MNTKVVFCHAGAKSFKSHRLPPPVTPRSNKTRITIEKYYICNRIERVKQLLLFEDLSLKEIARKMRYSRPSHLSNQFKKIAGSTPSEFKSLYRDKHLVPTNCGQTGKST